MINNIKHLAFTIIIILSQTTHTAPTDQDLITPLPSNKMSRDERREQILRLNIADKDRKWLNEEISCGLCTMTRDTAGNLLTVATACASALTTCFVIAHTVENPDDCARIVPLTVPCSFVAGGVGCSKWWYNRKEKMD